MKKILIGLALALMAAGAAGAADLGGKVLIPTPPRRQWKASTRRPARSSVSTSM